MSFFEFRLLQSCCLGGAVGEAFHSAEPDEGRFFQGFLPMLAFLACAFRIADVLESKPLSFQRELGVLSRQGSRRTQLQDYEKI